MAGSITMTLVKKVEAITPMKRQPSVLFNCGSEHFDPEQCVCDKEFIVNPKEEHVLLIGNLAQIPTMTVGNGQQLRKKQQTGQFLGFRIDLKQMDMTLTVGPKTPLSLLFNSGYFNIVPFSMTRDQYMFLAFVIKNEH